MEETIISINSANIISIAIMIFIVFLVAYFVAVSMGKMKGASDD